MNITPEMIINQPKAVCDYCKYSTRGAWCMKRFQGFYYLKIFLNQQGNCRYFERRNEMKDTIIYYLAYYGYKLGLGLIFSPVIWDIIMKSARGGEPIRVGTLGVFLQIIGGFLMLVSHLADRSFR